MNYFKILKLKEEELELLKVKLDEITLKVKTSQDYMLNIFDTYQKEQENLADLDKTYLEEYEKSSLKGLTILFFLVSLLALLLTFHFIPQFLIYVVASLGVFNTLTLFISFNVQKYLTNKYQTYRIINRMEIVEQKELIENLGIKKDMAEKEYHQLLNEKIALIKEVNEKNLEYENLRNTILKAFYPFLISLDEKKLEENLEYQEALKRIRKLNI